MKIIVVCVPLGGSSSGIGFQGLEPELAGQAPRVLLYYCALKICYTSSPTSTGFNNIPNQV